MKSSNFDNACAILNKYQHSSAKLVPILREVQDEYGYLPEELMTFVATALGISPAAVYGVATFFSHFTLKPKGKHIVRVCDGTACHVKHSDGIRTALRKELGLNDEEHFTTADMMFTLEMVACIGACSLAPAVVVDGKVHGLMTPKKVCALIKGIREKEVAGNE
jgi:NADH-quinone oxidoreductase subunit E